MLGTILKANEVDQVDDSSPMGSIEARGRKGQIHVHVCMARLVPCVIYTAGKLTVSLSKYS